MDGPVPVAGGAEGGQLGARLPQCDAQQRTLGVVHAGQRQRIAPKRSGTRQPGGVPGPARGRGFRVQGHGQIVQPGQLGAQLAERRGFQAGGAGEPFVDGAHLRRALDPFLQVQLAGAPEGIRCGNEQPPVLRANRPGNMDAACGRGRQEVHFGPDLFIGAQPRPVQAHHQVGATGSREPVNEVLPVLEQLKPHGSGVDAVGGQCGTDQRIGLGQGDRTQICGGVHGVLFRGGMGNAAVRSVAGMAGALERPAPAFTAGRQAWAGPRCAPRRRPRWWSP